MPQLEIPQASTKTQSSHIKKKALKVYSSRRGKRPQTVSDDLEKQRWKNFWITLKPMV